MIGTKRIDEEWILDLTCMRYVPQAIFYVCQQSRAGDCIDSGYHRVKRGLTKAKHGLSSQSF